MASVNRMRDQLRGWVPWFLSDRHFSSGKTVGFRFLWTLIATLDKYFEYAMQALQAPWPGQGTPSALPYIGRSRGILRGQSDTDATFAARLRDWLLKWASAGTQRQLAIELHEYLGNSPKVSVVNRAGHWVTVAVNGTVTTAQASLNWDSVSNPERVNYWSELFIVIYPTQWAHRATLLGAVGATVGGDALGIGHAVSRTEYDAVRAIVSQWKAAHSMVRAVVWTSDAALFDPAVPASLPNGQWGMWGTTGSAARVASSRNITTCRYWEL